ncbi:hypothetical protein LP420_31630 [Massilia sp. B-10]|nr:hypothetical protein LP420_31630 [Massilia sp. B-10]
MMKRRHYQKLLGALALTVPLVSQASPVQHYNEGNPVLRPFSLAVRA